jgi:hypothetical protein
VLRCIIMATLARGGRQGWVPVATVTLAVLLLLGLAGHHPQPTRQQAIDAALSKQVQGTAHYATKLVHESDLERAAPQWGDNTGPDYLLWVIALAGDYMKPGEYAGGAKVTWTILVVNDKRPAQLSGSTGGTRGNWPPFFDGLVDVS